MTVGALTQLQYGNTDRMAFLTLNPQITHFKSVYKKYTNFATQFLTVQPSIGSGAVSWDIDTKYTFQIPRDGDAIRDMYLTFELPDIYSDSNYKFQWIKRIGEYIIRDVTLQIDTDQSIDKHTSEWLHAYSELNYDEGKKKGYYKMIGNILELYDPSNAPGNNGSYPSTGYAPSIVNRKLYIPLIFWFNKFSSMSFPLIAMQYKIMYINVTLRPLKDLYTVIDYNGSGYRVKPSVASNVNTTYIGNFLNPSNNTISNLDVKPRLEINNMFLDNEERKRFALTSHEYLITQLQPPIINSNKVGGTIKIDLKNINKPVTELVFMIRRSDMEDVNDWSNFTNWNLNDIPPYSNGYSNQYGAALTLNSNNIQYYKNRNIVTNALLRLDTHEITSGNTVEGKDSMFFNLTQNFVANNNMPDEGIYTYSFSLDNSSIQPIGAVNMSSIVNKDIVITTIPINPAGGYNYPSSVAYNYNILVFAVNYEILTIMGGMASIQSSN